MKTGLLITARLKSTRLPLKLLIRLQGREVLRHVIDRAKTVYGIDEIILCTSTDPQDRPLVDIAREEGIHYYMGDGVDVLKRLKDAAHFYSIDSFISITADNPLFCVYHANRVSDLLRKSPSIDYIHLNGLPIGTAVYGLRTKALDVVCDFKKDDDTEIWGLWVNHPQVLNVVELKVDDIWNFDARLTLDNPEDLLFFQSICRHAKIPVSKINTQDIKDLVQTYADLKNINNHIVQKSIDIQSIERVKNLYSANRLDLRKKLGHD
ncbi:cytidylyltransferase domain-containing protein [Acinetobacter faecalis]|uniref:cytidylyltransferase domain-containing protein n=1 Tax=Acinetobacter faecalis TaxID=2665161 RepID=UPI002A91CBF6|nr:hypothetical protein [Acinetobacter faecalis]MDY6531273.1 hypothetical protein [Acinetobacter faecalis]